MKLIYLMDPMCSWCWAFREPLAAFMENHPELELNLLMGGLAPDNDQPMPYEQQQKIQAIWYHIEKLTGTQFNHDFWTKNLPKRSTYPACRAVLTAKLIGGEKAELDMAEAIQKAFYLRAMNPSESSTLIKLAEEIGLERGQFEPIYFSYDVVTLFTRQLEESRRLGVGGFPALLVQTADGLEPLTLGYTDLNKLEQRYKQMH